MIQFDFITPASPTAWDESLEQLGPVHPYQSSGFAACLESLGHTPKFLSVVENGKEVGRCLYFLHQGNRVSCFFGSPYKEALIDFWKSCGYSGIEYFTTSVAYKSPSEINEGNAETVVIRALGTNPLEKMAHSVRKNVKKCDTAGVVVEFRKDLEAVQIYLEMLKAHRKRLGQKMPLFYPAPLSLQLGNRGKTDFSIALATVEGKVLCGMGFLCLGTVTTEIAVAQGDAYFERKLPAQDYIKIKALEHFQQKGVLYYDLAGISPSPENEKEENIKRFKLKFSNVVVRYSKTGRLAFKTIPFWSSLGIEKARSKFRLSACFESKAIESKNSSL